MSGHNEQLESEIRSLAQAISSQAEALTRLANSNAMIAQALAEQIDDDGEDTPTAYLDGQPLG